FLVGEAGLNATGLLQPGSLVRWMYRVKLPDHASGERATAALIDDARAALPEAGWEIRSRSNASPQLERTINRFTQFLTLVGLAALLVGGVGVANAVKSHIDRRRDVIAAYKALGATGREVVGTVWHRPRWRYLALMAVVIVLLVTVVIGLAYDKRVASVFVASSVLVFALLRGIAAVLMALARRLPRPRFTMLRLAIANIYRPGALTPSVVMSLGLGLAVLVTITQIDGNL